MIIKKKRRASPRGCT